MSTWDKIRATYTAAAKARADAMLRQLSSGMTYQEIATQHGISRQRVWQILHRYCADRIPGRRASKTED